MPTEIMKAVPTASAVVHREQALPALRTYGWALGIGWIVLASAAGLYAHSRSLARGIALPLALAFLTEYSFYLLLGFGELRERIAQRLRRRIIAAAIAASAILPYLIATIPTGAFRFLPAIAWIAIASAVSFWLLTPISSPRLASFRDVLFLALLAVVIVSGVLRWIFPAPIPKLPLEVLGHVTLVRSAILAVLLLRGARGTRIGFIPRWKDVRIGGLWFVACAALALPSGGKLGQLHLAGRTPELWQALGLVLGVFWVVALSEEFFFRGLLQSWLADWTGSKPAGLVLASLLFASCHLWFRGFPNWRFAVVSAILGSCCGAAFLHARSIRASMVTHALAVGAWRLFFT